MAYKEVNYKRVRAHGFLATGTVNIDITVRIALFSRSLRRQELRHSEELFYSKIINSARNRSNFLIIISSMKE